MSKIWWQSLSQRSRSIRSSALYSISSLDLSDYYELKEWIYGKITKDISGDYGVTTFSGLFLFLFLHLLFVIRIDAYDKSVKVVNVFVSIWRYWWAVNKNESAPDTRKYNISFTFRLLNS